MKKLTGSNAILVVVRGVKSRITKEMETERKRGNRLSFKCVNESIDPFIFLGTLEEMGSARNDRSTLTAANGMSKYAHKTVAPRSTSTAPESFNLSCITQNGQQKSLLLSASPLRRNCRI